MSTQSILLREPGNPWLALVGIAVPGAGHWLLGERSKAIAVFVVVHVMIVGALLAGAAVMPPIPPEPMYIASYSQSDPIGTAMRTLETVAQRSGGIAVWGTLFFGYREPFVASFTKTFITNILSLAGILNLLASFYLFDERRALIKAQQAEIAAAKGKKR